MCQQEQKGIHHFIFMEYHAIEDAESWHEVQEILVERAAAGIEVRVFYDDMGSIGFITTDFVNRLRDLGIKAKVFNPMEGILNVIFNNRDHRKITVVDGKVGFTGGYNIANEYFMAWAMLAVILISILCWLAKRCRSLARKYGMVEYNLNYEEAYEAVGWVDSFLANIRSVAMGAFLLLGTTNGCVALAVLMVASSLLFAITLRPYYERMREKDEFYSVRA